MMPRYFIGTWQQHLDVVNGDYDANTIGEYVSKYLAEDADVTPDTPCLIIMRNPDGIPHPSWRELPHVLDTTQLQTHMQPPPGQPERRAAVAAALAQTCIPIASGDTTYSFAMKVHAKVPRFRP